MSEVGVRELKQNASDLVRRAEVEEQLTITVSGRPAAVLGPIQSQIWRTWDDIAEILGEPVDADWVRDRDLVDQTIADPWSQS